MKKEAGRTIIGRLGVSALLCVLMVLVLAPLGAPTHAAHSGEIRYLSENYWHCNANSNYLMDDFVPLNDPAYLNGSKCGEERDIVYDTATDDWGPTGDGTPGSGAVINLLMDRYTPKNTDTATDRPALIWVHGGGFTSQNNGTSTATNYNMEKFTSAGYVTFAIDYRLCNIATFPQCDRNTNPESPEQVYLNAKYDAQAAVRYVREHAAEYGIDPNRIMIGGESSGAVISYGVVYVPEDDGPDYSGTTSSAVALGLIKGQNAYSDFFSVPFTTLHKATTGEPPVAFFIGEEDEGVESARYAYRYLRSKGIQAELYVYPLGDHSLDADQEPRTPNYQENYRWRFADFAYRRLPLSTAITSSTPQMMISLSDIYFTTNRNASPDPPPQTITITNVGGGTLNWSATVPAGVTTFSPSASSGNGLQHGESDTITVDITPTTQYSVDRCMGTYPTASTCTTYTVTISASGAAVTPVKILIRDRRRNDPQLQVRPISFGFSTNTTGSPGPATQVVTLQNVGGGTLNWSSSESYSWLSLTPTSGSLTANATAEVQASFLPPVGEAPCQQSGIEALCGYFATFNGDQAEVWGLNFYFSDQPRIFTTPTELYYLMPANQTSTLSRTFTLTNFSGGTLQWQATPPPGGATTLSPSSGSLASNASVTVTATVTGNPGSLGTVAGGLITITSTGTSPAPDFPTETIAMYAVAF